MAVRIETQAEPIPGYKLLERLGGGGFGEVWKATAPGGILKAIKFVYGSLQTVGDEETQRAEQELKALSRVKSVRHPYILSLERYDIIDGQLLIVMELADRNLWDRFRECRAQGLPGIPRIELLGYMQETAEALDLMNIHYQLQHLDIKPQNLFLVHNHAKVADFGLVKDLEGIMASVTGGVTPVYAAPETFDGWVSRFCDQYSLAIVYQELLTGQRPFNGSTVRQLVLQHLQTPPNLTSLPANDREVIGRALAKEPEERFPTCLDLVRALRGAGGAELLPGAHAGEELRPGADLTPSSGSDETASGGWPAANHAGQPAAAASGVAVLSPPGSGEREAHYLHVAKASEPRPVASPPAVEETHGSGLLFPALVLGLGGLGLAVLRRLRAYLQEQFGPPTSLPNIRLLYLDTDPEALAAAGRGGAGAVLSPAEVLPAKLHRACHYLRSHEGRDRIDSWFNLKMLYRIPRHRVTTGCRALGRLAFMDNYRLIARRLKAELEASARPEDLAAAAQQTGLGLRSNRPRIYIVTGLAGGTGSGMFLDLAYVVRNLARILGYKRPEVIGLFLLPPVDRQPEQRLALANVFAALTELYHFSTPGVPFTARYEERGKPLAVSEPPYNRCLLLPLAEGTGEGPAREAAGLAADFLRRDLTTPLGRAADESRAGLPDRGGPPPELTCQTFGLYRISWPRQALVHGAAGWLCRQAVQRWMTKDASGVRETVRAAVADLWSAEELGGERLLARLEKACEQALGRPAAAGFEELTRPLAQVDPQGAEAALPVLLGTLEQLEGMLGRPDSTLGTVPGTLLEPLQAAGNALATRWEEKLATFAVQLIEQPAFRLAGAEEAVRQVVALLEQQLGQHEPLAKELTARAAEARAQIAELLLVVQAPAPGNRRTTATLAGLLELLRAYPRWRYQSLILQWLVRTYVSLRGLLSDQLREINFCRNRLQDLLRSFEEPTRDRSGAEALGSVRNLFPLGCRTVEEAVEQLVAGITPEEVEAFELQVQELIKQQFTALVHVCTASSNLIKKLQLAMQQQAEDLVSARLVGADVAEMYLASEGRDEQARDDVAGIFEEAAPRLIDPGRSGRPEVCVLATPPGPAGERFRELARQALPEVSLTTVPGTHDIVFYRELPEIALAELEHVGPLAYEAYAQVAAADSFTPHSRTDITAWRSPAAG